MGDDLNGFIAGWFAGCIGLIVSHPMDTIRVRMQTQGHAKHCIMYYFKTIIQKEKGKGLFKGMSCPLLGQAAINATVFGVESMVYRRLKPREGETVNVVTSFVAGACAGAVQTFIACPMELIKIRLQNQGIGKQHLPWLKRKFDNQVVHDTGSKPYSGPLKLTRKILDKEGIRGMFRGWWITFFREVPQFGIYFGTYAWMRTKLATLTNTPPEDLGVLLLSVAGGVTGVATWLWYPADVIKSRLQFNGVIGNKSIKYKGIVDCVRKSFKSEGAIVFVKGLQPTLIRGFLNGFVTLPVFTINMRLLSSEYCVAI